MQELSGLALNEFILRRTGKTWDDIPEQRASLDDLDIASIRQFLKDAKKAKRINVEDDISASELIDKLRLLENGRIKRAAVLFFGKDPGKFYPSLAVKIGKFGASDADLKFHEVIEGNLIQLKEGIIENLNTKFFIRPIEFQGMQRVEKDEYPVAAVREMILNALVHRNYMGAPTQIRLYDTNFSIWNDGGLPEGITEEYLKKTHPSKPRNPLLADLCFKAGYIDAWGRGTLKIIEACKENGLPEPVLKEEHGGFLSKINKDRFTLDELKKYGLSNRQIKAIEFVKDYGKITNSNYQELNNVSRNTASSDLGILVNLGLFQSSDIRGAGAFYILR